MAKDLRLSLYCVLLSVGAIEWIKVCKEFSGVWLLDFPRRITYHGIKTGTWAGKDVWKFQFPMEEVICLSKHGYQLTSRFWGLFECRRRWRLVKLVGRPEPDGTPGIECCFELL